MAFLQMDYFSAALDQGTCVNILLPEGKEISHFKTLWLLHGLSDNQNAWMKWTAVDTYAREQGIAVVMPCVDRSWYTDTACGKNYFTFVTEELPRMMGLWFKGYSSKREDNLIAGLSMGGYGALKAALTYPENYAFCAAFSGALDITRKNRAYNLAEWRSIFGYDLTSADELAGTKHDLFALAENLAPRQKDIPKLYLWCGEQDDLLAINQDFSAHLTNLGIPHTFETSEGNHSWRWWDLHLQSALKNWQTK